MKKKLGQIKYIGTLLLIIAFILDVTVGLVGYIWGFIASAIRGELNSYHQDIAVSEDIFGNVLCRYFFNFILIKASCRKNKTFYSFGFVRETVSSCLGKNKALNALNRLGRWIANDLDAIQPNHVEDAIQNNI